MSKKLISTVHECIEAQASTNPHELAVIFGDQSCTYALLNQRANQLAHYLKTIGISSEHAVALCLERSIETLVAMLAILKTGAYYVPIDPKLPYERLSFILKNCMARACITTIHLHDSLSALNIPVIVYDKMAINISEQNSNSKPFDKESIKESDISRYPITNLNQAVPTQHLAYAIYTSGTTGNPKGVLIEHQSVINYAAWFTQFTSLTPQMRIDWSSNFMFDMAVTSTLVSLMSGLTIVICKEETHRHFSAYLHYLTANQIQLIKSTPSYFKELLREAKARFYDLPSLGIIVLGGEALSAADCIDWLACFPHQTLINEYGPTEATVAFSQYTINQSTLLSTSAPVPIGMPGLNMYYYILDSDQQKVLDGEAGELYIGGMGLARGYLNLPELTQSRFIPDPFIADCRLYKTGDLCRQLPNGFIEYLGRLDRQVKIRGFRIELTEVEQCLENHPAIQDVVVFVREQVSHDKQLVAYYILKDKRHSLSYKDMVTFMRNTLPYYMIPATIICVDAFPMANNGKLDESLLSKEITPTSNKIKTGSKFEQIIAKIWAEELGVASVGIDENFLELGGHSFIAARIMSAINQLLGINITPYHFYDAMTVKKMARIAKEMKKQTVHEKNIHVQRQKKLLPLSDFQTILWACKTFKPKAAKLNVTSRKRLQGPCDIQALNRSFDSIIQKHHILSYSISKAFPVQKIKKKKAFHLLEETLNHVSDDIMESILWNSMEELAQFSAWTSTEALIRAKLFYLQDEIIELQISIPHIIFDGLSMNILFSELSEFYLLHRSQLPHDISNDSAQFSDYVLAEQLQYKARSHQDMAFWSDYLKDAHLFYFPKQYIVNVRDQEKFSYSSYIPIPEQAFHHLEVFSMHKQINFNEALSATIVLALQNCCEDKQRNTGPIFMNIVKSNRDNFLFNETIGCFLKIEPIKLLLNKSQSLESLIEQIKSFSTKHLFFQQSSSMLKLASLNQFYRKKKSITYFLAQLSIFIYRKVLQLMKISHATLKLCPTLSLLDEKSHFMIYLNIWSNFLNPIDENENHLFGLKLKRIKMHQYDLLTVNNLFEVCFLRNENNDPYVVISSNLDSSFREKIAHEIIRIMKDDMLSVNTVN